MFFGIVPMFVATVAKDFARRRFLAQICANSCAHAHFGAYLLARFHLPTTRSQRFFLCIWVMRARMTTYLRDEALSNRILGYGHWNYPKEHAYQFS